MNGCGHTHHVGTCPACQRAQLARWRRQLEEAVRPAHVSPAWPRGSNLQWNPATVKPPEPSATLTTF
jgi:hypothetical protein